MGFAKQLIYWSSTMQKSYILANVKKVKSVNKKRFLVIIVD